MSDCKTIPMAVTYLSWVRIGDQTGLDTFQRAEVGSGNMASVR
jgi:hypothetical protein